MNESGFGTVALLVIAVLVVLLALASVALFLTKAKLRKSRAVLGTMAVTDELTGISNRRYLLARFEEEFQEHRRQRTALGCITIDLDQFKKINEAFGHEIGDAVLKEFARITKGCIRVYDIFGRTGGEEFMILLPVTTLVQAMAFAERVRKTVERDLAVKTPSGEIVRATISLGVSGLRDDDSSIDGIAKRADEARDRAKESGRNRAELA